MGWEGGGSLTSRQRIASIGPQLPAPYCNPRKRKTSCSARLSPPSSSSLSPRHVLSWVLDILLVQTSTTSWSSSSKKDASSRLLGAIDSCRLPCKTFARAFAEIPVHRQHFVCLILGGPLTNSSHKAKRTTIGRLQEDVSHLPLGCDVRHRGCEVFLRLGSAIWGCSSQR